ncbi:MAG TPA: 3D domain-containing protein [Blastocatellia bacterium]|nr:3D domain-containing protein [Blastocatellia bacterium]
MLQGSMRRILPLTVIAAGVIFSADQITEALDRAVSDSPIRGSENPADAAKASNGDSSGSADDESALRLAGRPRRVEPPSGTVDNAAPKPNASPFFEFEATAYSLKGRTASGHYVQPGVIAADPRLLPLGTVVELKAGEYSGNYTVLDTGGAIKGSRIDIYMPSERDAMNFGRKTVKLRVIKSNRARVAKRLSSYSRRVM